MSLKIEQRIIGNQITEFEPKIYSTGVHLIPMKVELDGKEKFVWVADEFGDDTSLTGKMFLQKFLQIKLKNCLLNNSKCLFELVKETSDHLG